MREASPRRDAILEAATSVFLRYGFRKTSMDDLARAAGLSRQGLYLHFATKEALFSAAVEQLVARTRASARAAFAQKASVAERVLAGFVAFHGQIVGPGSAHMTELMEAAAAVIGPVQHEVETEFVGDLARALKPVAAKWKLSAKALAEQLNATSSGFKHSVKSAEEYEDRMRIAVRMVCGD